MNGIINSTGGVNVPNLGGVVNTGGMLSGAVPQPNINPNAGANGNVSLVFDRNGNLLSGNGIMPLGLGLPSLLGGSQNNTSTTSTGSAQTGPSFVVYQSDVAAANNNPYASSQFSTSNGGTIVYYYVVPNPNGVQSNDNLQNFAAYSVANDENLKKAAVDTSGIDLTYDQAAKLFGFIPSHVPVDVHIGADGTATTDYPWYGFLMDTNEAELQSAIQSKVDSVLNQNVNPGDVVGGVNLPGANAGGDASGGGTVSGSVSDTTAGIEGGLNGGGNTNALDTAAPQTKAQILDGVHSVLQTSSVN